MSADQEMSKSARKRANQKAREAEAAAEAPAPAPAPVAKAKAKAEAAPKAKAAAAPKAAAEPKAEAKAKAKGKAKAEPKAAAAPEPKAAAKSEPKAKAKGAAKAQAAPAPEQPKAEAKPKAKKAKAKKEEEVVEAPKIQESSLDNTFMDDGQGGDWEVAAGVSKKDQKRNEKKQEQAKAEEQAKIEAAKAEKAALKSAGLDKKVTGGQSTPGLGLPSVQEILAGAKAKGLAEAAAKAAARAAENAANAKPAKEGEAKEAVPVPADQTAATIKVPQEKIGRVIGPKGANITLIKEKTGVTSVDTAGDVVTLVGPQEAVTLAEAAIRQLLEKGYMSLAFEDFMEDGVNVNPNSIPDIIGSRGAIIQVIKKECKVEIDIPPVPKNAPAGKKVRVSIAGGKVGVEKAQEIINSIAAFSHHEVTHPGFTHAEMEVEEWRYRFLIGKGGCEMRHIQNNYKVKVNIPRETSTTDKVVVIGEASGVERAVKYIEKILADAEVPKGRDAPEKAEDTWGDEGPEESWMSAYMYKRRA